MKKNPFKPNMDACYRIHEAEVKYRTTVLPMQRRKIISSTDCAEHFRAFWGPDIELCEDFKVMYLNKSNHIICIYNMARGNDCGVCVDLKSMLYIAVDCRCCAIVLAHNHPSGGLKPSRADGETTMKIKSTAQLLDIKLLDHIILGVDGYYSFADEGIL